MTSWADDPRCVVSRQELWKTLTPAALAAVAIGDSLFEGTGTTVPLPDQLEALLTQFTGLANFIVTNRGVGGSGVAVGLGYVADVLSAGSNGNSYPMAPASGAKFELARPLILDDGLRNDLANALPPDIYIAGKATFYQTCLKKGLTPVLVTPPPQLDWDGVPGHPWSIKDNNNPGAPHQFCEYYDPLVALCESMGVTLVDFWKLCSIQASKGFDLTTIMHDATHWNDLGAAMACHLILLALACPREEPKADWSAPGLAYPDIIANYFPFSGVTALTQLSGSTTTARRDETGETANKGYVLASGQSQSYRSAGPLKGVIVDFCGAANGSVSVSVGGTVIGTVSCADPNRRENSVILPIDSASPAYNSIADITLTNAGGTPNILGIKMLCANMLACDDAPDCIVSSGWAKGTFGGSGTPFFGKPCWMASTVGAAISFRVTGRFWPFFISMAAGRGTFALAIDGGAPQAVDCYSPLPTNQVPLAVDLLTEGEHVVTLTVGAPNPAVGGAWNVQVGSFRTYTDHPSNLRQVIPAAGISADTRQIFTPTP